MAKIIGTTKKDWFESISPWSHRIYISIRHTDIPVFIYCLFAYTTVLFLVELFDLCRDQMLAVRASENALSRLRSTVHRYLSRLPMKERMRIAKAGKALHPAFFSVCNYTQFNVNVPVGVWEETLNQTVFLLTL